MFTRERHRRGVVYFGPYANAKKVRETLDVLNRVFRFRPCEGPQPGRHSGIPCLDYHIDRCLAPCVGYVSKEDYAELIDGVIQFLSGDTKSIQRELERQMTDAAALERFEDAARYRNRLFAVRHLAERQGGGAARVRDDRRDRHRRRATGGGGAGLPAARRQARRPAQLPPRERRGAGHPDGAGGVLPRVLRLGAERAAARSSCRRRRPTRRRSRSSCPSGAGRASRCARRSAARSAGCRSSRRRTRSSRSRPTLAADRAEAAAARRGARGAARGAQPGEPAGADRVLRHLEHPAESPVGSMVVFQDALPKKAHYRKFGMRALTGPDDFAAMAEVVSRRFARLADVTAEDYDESFAPGAEPRRHRRRQGAAVGGARGDAGVRPAARRGDLAREARGGDLPAAPARSGAARPPLAGPAAAAADPRRGAPLRARLPPAAARRAREESIFERLAGRRAGAAPRARCSTSARPSGSSRRARRSSRRCPGCRRRPRARSTRSCTRRAAAEGWLSPASRRSVGRVFEGRIECTPA